MSYKAPFSSLENAVFSASTQIPVSISQFPNAPISTLVTLAGSVTLVKVEQFAKDEPPITFTPVPKPKAIRFVQSLKARSPISLTLFGMVKTFSAEQPMNALASMISTPSSKVMPVIEEHRWNADSPIYRTLEGIVRVFRFLHCMKARPAIRVVPSFTT